MEVHVIRVYEMPTRVLIAKLTTLLKKEPAITKTLNVSGSLKRPNVIPSIGHKNKVGSMMKSVKVIQIFYWRKLHASIITQLILKYEFTSKSISASTTKETEAAALASTTTTMTATTNTTLTTTTTTTSTSTTTSTAPTTTTAGTNYDAMANQLCVKILKNEDSQ